MRGRINPRWTSNQTDYANGNRLTRTVNSVTENYSYDDADKLQDVKVGGVTQKSYGYDAAGRTTSVVSGAGTTTLAYDYEGRITQITYPSTATNTFAYNGLDTRVSKVDSAGTSTYKRDGAGVTAPVLNDGSATYTPGISERRSSTTTFLHSGLKNADSQTGTGQTIGATKQYDAFGNVLSSTGTWKGPFGYAGSFGYQEDADSSLKQLGHRYYDASTGRFLTRDPIKDGRNWYVYALNSPTNRADPSGLSSLLNPQSAILAAQCLLESGAGQVVVRLTANQLGQIGVRQLIKELTKELAAEIATEVTIIIVDGVRYRIRPDVGYVDANDPGVVHIGEAKNSPNPRFTPNQSKVYPALESAPAGEYHGEVRTDKLSGGGVRKGAIVRVIFDGVFDAFKDIWR